MSFQVLSFHGVHFCVFFSEVEPLLKMAADKGVEEAKKALKDLYPHRYT